MNLTSLRAALPTLFAFLLTACARTPAECAAPDVVPAPPVAHAERRIVAALDEGGDACHVRLRLPDDTRAEDWAVARDAALREATLAASAACCPAATPKNAERWPAGAKSFDLAFGCVTAR